VYPIKVFYPRTPSRCDAVEQVYAIPSPPPHQHFVRWNIAARCPVSKVLYKHINIMCACTVWRISIIRTRFNLDKCIQRCRDYRCTNKTNICAGSGIRRWRPAMTTYIYIYRGNLSLDRSYVRIIAKTAIGDNVGEKNVRTIRRIEQWRDKKICPSPPQNKILGPKSCDQPALYTYTYLVFFLDVNLL